MVLEMPCDKIVNALEEAINIVDRLEKELNRLKPGEEVTPGVIYRFYNELLLLREKIVAARMTALGYNSEK